MNYTSLKTYCKQTQMDTSPNLSKSGTDGCSSCSHKLAEERCRADFSLEKTLDIVGFPLPNLTPQRPQQSGHEQQLHVKYSKKGRIWEDAQQERQRFYLFSGGCYTFQWLSYLSTRNLPFAVPTNLFVLCFARTSSLTIAC